MAIRNMRQNRPLGQNMLKNTIHTTIHDRSKYSHVMFFEKDNSCNNDILIKEQCKDGLTLDNVNGNTSSATLLEKN